MTGKRAWLAAGVLLAVLAAAAGLVKVKVITENANLKEAPEIGAKTITKLPLDTVLQVEGKTGEWYKVSLSVESRLLVGYIHEMLVSAVADNQSAVQVKDTPWKKPETKDEPPKPGTAKEAAPGLDKGQAEILADIEIQLAKGWILIREERRYDEALTLLSPLAARALRVTDRGKQTELTTQIFLMKGVACAGRGDEEAARAEFRNMFEVDAAAARALSKNIFDAKIVSLLKQAEMGYLGLVVENTINVTSVPSGAKIRIDGRDLGVTPVSYKTQSSRALIEIVKEGYQPVRDDIVLDRKETRKEYRLEPGSLKLAIVSVPAGAKFFFDGRDTNLVTNAELAEVQPGEHVVRLVKDFYADWEIRISVKSGVPPDPIRALLTGTSYAPAKVWGDSESSLFIKPGAVAVDKNGRILIADESPAKLKMLSASGDVAAGGGTAAAGLATILRPGGIAVDSQGRIYVTDPEAHLVWTLDHSGNVERSWGDFGAGDGQFNTPTGVAADSAGSLFIVDSGNNRVKKYSSQGALIKAWGQSGGGKGGFVSPRAVAVGSGGEVYVLDSERVQKFTGDGVWIGGWGSQGTAPGELNDPQGLCVDAAGAVYVADTGNHRIQKFDAQGKFLCSWGSLGREQGFLDAPCGIAVDTEGAVYVVERGNSRVQVFIVGSFGLGASKR